MRAFSPVFESESDFAEFFVDGCETIHDVQTRALKKIEGIFSRNAGKNLAVVSHLIVVRSIILKFLDLPISDFRSIKVSNASIVELVRKNSGRTEVILE